MPKKVISEEPREGPGEEWKLHVVPKCYILFIQYAMLFYTLVKPIKWCRYCCMGGSWDFSFVDVFQALLD
jgi:hypothetical protein